MPIEKPDLDEQEIEGLLDEVVAELEKTRTACFVLDAALRLRWASTELHAMMGAGRDELGYGRHLIEALGLPAWTDRLTADTMHTAGERLMPFVVAHAQAYDG